MVSDLLSPHNEVANTQLYYVDEVIELDDKRFLGLELITKESVERISQKEYISNFISENQLIEIPSKSGVKKYLDSFFVLSRKEKYVLKDLRNAKKGGNEPLAYLLRNSVLGMNRAIRNKAKPSIDKRPKKEIAEDKWIN